MNLGSFSITLPILVNQENKLWAALWMYLFAGILYLTSNHIHLIDPSYLPLTWIDIHTPFMPKTFWVYSSEYLLFGAVILIARESRVITQYVYAFLAIQAFSTLVFWVWPTIYPRENFPLTDTVDPITRIFFDNLRAIDSSANCCPSLHVSSVFLCAFVFRHEQREKFWPFLAWAIAISVSTLTTKQHYLIDLVTGLAVAVVFYWLFFIKAEYILKRQ